jgi:hypothetical protein
MRVRGVDRLTTQTAISGGDGALVVDANGNLSGATEGDGGGLRPWYPDSQMVDTQFRPFSPATRSCGENAIWH